MSNSPRFALQAFRSIQRITRPQVEILPKRFLNRSTSLSSRNFYTQSPRFAQAATASAPSTPPPSTATASETENALKSESHTQSQSPPLDLNDDQSHVDWSKSFQGLGNEAFPKQAADILLAPIDPEIVEIKPDGIIYLPEIHYRRILNKAFGPGAWGLAPRGDTIVTDKAVTREYALIAHGRLVSIARGEQDYFSKDGIPTASEGCKSNAMMRCCKDLGIASELWDPRYVRNWKAKHSREVFVEHQVSKKRTKLWLRKGDPVSYPYKETSGAAGGNIYSKKADSAA